MSITTVRVWKREGMVDPRGDKVLHEIRHFLGINSVTQVRTVRVFRLEGITSSDANHLSQALLADPIQEEYAIETPHASKANVVEVAYQPGMTNPEVASLVKAASDLGVKVLAADIAVEYHLFGAVSDEEIEQIIARLLVNNTTQLVVKAPPTTLIIQGQVGTLEEIRLHDLDEKELAALADSRRLYLSPLEMQAIQGYFQRQERDPTDVELETLAQTWSEHCVHKTFRSPLLVNGQSELPLFEMLKNTASKFDQGVASLFVDNSGVLYAFEGWCICGKVETHNSPSAIAPYGGAATGTGGVIRDILGTGQGGLVLLNTDIFCLGPLGTKFEDVPAGCLDPGYIFRNVVAGVGGYGNPMGIPTSNGSVHFHPGFVAKPSIIVGAFGLMPEKYAKKGKPSVGDRIIAVGGRTGRDGIHGATFSSASMTSQTISVNATAVQIGNPIEEKAAHDAILAARDRDLIVALTDCGAGGFSSAIGEMGADLGVLIHLEKAPLKYSGLAPWEIWISESQERMIVAVAPEGVDNFITLCGEYAVEAVELGEFTGSGRLIVKYGDQDVCNLGMEFLHNGVPLPERVAKWEPSYFEEPNLALPDTAEGWVEVLKGVLSHPDVCSKETLVKRYDQGVQGGSILPPFTGVHNNGPNDAVVIKPVLDQKWALVASHGLNPVLNQIDPYWGSLWAVAEALANYVAVGGSIDEKMGLIDNFIWPTPDQHYLGALFMAVQALCDAMNAFERPFISGKDSLSSTYRGPDGSLIHVPPVMCVSAFGSIADAGRTVTSDFKKEGSLLVLLGELNPEQMGGSVYYRNAGFLGGKLPHVDLVLLPTLFRELHERIVSGEILSCHDISEGGVATTLAEMCFGGGLGASIDVSCLGSGRADHLLFNEMAGCFLIEMDAKYFGKDIFPGLSYQVVGYTTTEPTIRFLAGQDQLCSVSIEELIEAWAEPLVEVFP